MKNLFFVFGAPKSGTSWLSMLVNSHSAATCRAEDPFSLLISWIPDLLEKYNYSRKNMVAKTTKADLQDQFDTRDAATMFRMAVELLAEKADTLVSGFHCNTVMEQFPVYMQVFDDAKFIHIYRDPRDVVVSSWHHNLRIEDGFLSRAHSLEDWAINTAKSWVDLLTAAEQYGDRIKWVKYEDLLKDTPGVLSGVYGYLGLDPIEVFKAVDKCRFDKLKASGNEFYRKGQAGTWKEELDAEMLAGMYAVASDKMKQYGYEVE